MKMMVIRRIVFIFVLLLFSNFIYADVPKNNKEYSAETNLAYIALSAVSINQNNIFLVSPLYLQLKIFDYISLNPTLVHIYNNNNKTDTISSMVLFEFGVAFHPKNTIQGWNFGLHPGLVYSFDSNIAGLSILLNGGYKWLIGKNLILGALAGVRYVYIEGHLIIPDLALKIGYKF